MERSLTNDTAHGDVANGTIDGFVGLDDEFREEDHRSLLFVCVDAATRLEVM